MMRTAVLAALSLTLASCATPSAHPVPPAEPPKPAACPPELEAAVTDPPAQPAGATIVQPVTVDEEVAVSLHLAWVQDLVAYAVQYRDRAKVAKAECEQR